LFFPYGPGQTDRLIPNLIVRVRQGTPVVLAGGRGFPLSPTFVEDIADVFVTALEGGWTGCLDVAAPEVASLQAVAEEIGRQLCVAPVFDRVDGPPPVPFLPDVAPLGRRYDLRRFRPFREGLAAVLAGGA
jgi:nucleoside-diphosphate-sugar epimerase